MLNPDKMIKFYTEVRHIQHAMAIGVDENNVEATIKYLDLAKYWLQQAKGETEFETETKVDVKAISKAKK